MASKFNLEGWRSDGALLAGADPAAFPHVGIRSDIGQPHPGFDGKFEEFVQQYPNLRALLHNDIKKCPDPECKKICAKIMPTCNGCGRDLRDVPVSQSPNMFTSFIYGIREGNFPFLVSMRYEREDIMVFDDPLAITRAHVLSVPTDTYCPDIRYLFSNPAAAIELLIKVEACAWLGLYSKLNGNESSFLRNEAWLQKAMSASGRDLLKDGSARARGDLRDCLMAAFNLPPSQYQLHLQYMLPPMLPQQVGIFKAGVHFKKGRHFPLRYVVEGLLAFQDAGRVISNPEDTSAEDLIKAISEVGIDYEAAWNLDQQRFERNCAKLANFSEKDFKYAVVGETVLDRETGQPAPDAPEAKSVFNQDKMAMQGYGRPYNASGKPGGTYYKHFLKPDQVIPTFGATTEVAPWKLPPGEEL